MQCLAFDFYQARDNLQPQETALSLPIHTSGLCNALAFWFELHLDEATSLSTSPYAAKVTQCRPALYSVSLAKGG